MRVSWRTHRLVRAVILSLAVGVSLFCSTADADSAAKLQSAYLLRSRGGSSQAPEEARDEILRLWRHFDVVVRHLVWATDASIATALDRLEGATGGDWDEPLRSSWRRELLANRRLQVARLIAYRNRGLFPKMKGIPRPPCRSSSTGTTRPVRWGI